MLFRIGLTKNSECQAILVGTAQKFLPDLIERASKLKVSQGFEKSTDLYVCLIPYAGLDLT